MNSALPHRRGRTSSRGRGRPRLSMRQSVQYGARSIPNPSICSAISIGTRLGILVSGVLLCGTRNGDKAARGFAVCVCVIAGLQRFIHGSSSQLTGTTTKCDVNSIACVCVQGEPGRAQQLPAACGAENGAAGAQAHRHAAGPGRAPLLSVRVLLP